MARQVLFVALLSIVTAFQFELGAQDQKCFLEHLARDTHFRAKYASEEPIYNQFLDVTTQEPAGEIIKHDKASDSGVIDFFAPATGYHQVCFTTRTLRHGRSDEKIRRVSFDVHAHAGDAGDIIDYAYVARREHLEPIELNLRLIDENLRSTHEELHQLRVHEATLEGDLDTMLSRLRNAGILLLLVVAVWGGVAWRMNRSLLRRHRILD